jgi:hypothetical protein
MVSKSVALMIALALSGTYALMWGYAMMHLKEPQKRGPWSLPSITTWWAFNEQLFEDRCKGVCRVGKIVLILTAAAYIHWLSL